MITFSFFSKCRSGTLKQTTTVSFHILCSKSLTRIALIYSTYSVHFSNGHSVAQEMYRNLTKSRFLESEIQNTSFPKINTMSCGKFYLDRFHPFTGHEGPQGEQGYSSTLFLTSALEGGEGSASPPGRNIPPGKTRHPLYRRAGGPQGRSGQVRKISPPPGFDPRTVQPVGSRYTDYATRLTENFIYVRRIVV